MGMTRREFGKLAVAGLPAAAAWFETPLVGPLLAQARPNSLVNGVQLGTITYSFRSMPDQSAEAILKYVVDSGFNAIEFMGAPVERFAGAPSGAGRGGGGGRAGAGGGANSAAGEGRNAGGGRAGRRSRHRSSIPFLRLRHRPPAPGAVSRARPRGVVAVAAIRQPARHLRPAMPGTGAAVEAARAPEQQEAAAALRQWRTSVSMDRFKDLRRMFNDAGVTIYAWKQLSPNMTDEEMEYVFNVAEALGCTHTTLELPGGPEAAADLKRIGAFAERKNLHGVPHASAGQPHGLRRGVCGLQGKHGERRPWPLCSGGR